MRYNVKALNVMKNFFKKLWVKISTELAELKDFGSKVYCIFVLMLFALGIGSAMNSIYTHQYVLAFGSICTSAMAFPYVKEIFKKLDS